nr:Toll/interleukin-1 receptor (TIR) domain-containing protein [Tanacetum cinerariifolium]
MGECKEVAIRILESRGFHARIGLKVLEQRSLITISPKYGKYGKLVLGMHDHLEEMGKNIVRHEHPDEPNKHSRLWIKEEIEDILDNDMGTEATRCLKLRTPSIGNSRIVMKGLGKIKKLQYLEVDLAFYKFKMKKLQFLEVLNKLKFLSLAGSNLMTFDFRITPNLENLSLTYCDKLKELFMPVCCQKLKYLYITRSKLRNFDLGLTPNLETFSLFDFADFVELQVSAPYTNLRFIKLYKTRLRSLDLELIPNLETLDLTDCDELVEIIAPAGCPNLERLDLFGCTHFVKLQVSAPCPKLKSLDIMLSRLRSLDLELIPNLESLHLSFCRELVEINAPVGCLKKLVELYLDGCVLFEKLPEDLGRFGCLKQLDILDNDMGTEATAQTVESLMKLDGVDIEVKLYKCIEVLFLLLVSLFIKGMVYSKILCNVITLLITNASGYCLQLKHDHAFAV